jgi:RsiW-degrading membrane proteinase PrsW (M82 family)
VQPTSGGKFRGAPVSMSVAMPDPVSTFMPGLQRRHYAIFWAVLGAGFGLLVAMNVLAVGTRSVPIETVFVVAGSLFTPCLFVYYLDLRNHFADPRWQVLVPSFLLGGVIGVPLALVLEVNLLRGNVGSGNPVPPFEVGLIEEGCKALVVFLVLLFTFKRLKFEMDGIIVGAAVGMGFAALEDMAYGADSFVHHPHAGFAVVWLRIVTGAFGHGTWTGIAAGAMWKAKRTGPPTISIAVFGAYLIAVLLHGAWDWQPFPEQYALADLGVMLAVGILGLVILRFMVHDALGQEDKYLAAHPQVAPGGAAISQPEQHPL